MADLQHWCRFCAVIPVFHARKRRGPRHKQPQLAVHEQHPQTTMCVPRAATELTPATTGL